MFSEVTKPILNNKTYSLIYQYHESTDEKSVLAPLIELAALLGIKSADDNPCHQFFIRKCAIVKQFGFLCHPSEEYLAIEKLVKSINDMAASKWINASLYNLGRIRLSRLSLEEVPKVAVFAYLAVPGEHMDSVKMTYGNIMFEEGGVPPEFK